MLQTIEIELLKVGKRSDFTHPAFTLLVDAINLQLLRIKTLHQRGGRAKTFPDIEVGTMTRLFFPVAHVWIEQMAKYRTDGKDWKDILSLAKSDHWDGLYSWQACPDACKSFCSEVEKLRSE
jgi:hypothetical protein